jgi:hypothetical protein
MVMIDAGDGRMGRQTATDNDGRFLFDRLPDGRFLVTASKSGWVTSYYGSPRPGRPPGVRVAVRNGARAEIEIPMIPGSVIAGRTVDEGGRPALRQFPLLLESRMVGDRRMLARVNLPLSNGWFERSTDDLGEFRLFGLPPGTYYLVLNPSIASGTRITTNDEVRWAMQPPGGSPPTPAPIAGYTAFYFPGTPDPASAQPIVLGPGEVRDGLEFRILFVPVSRVTGTVRRPDGAPAAGAVVTLADRVKQVSLEGSSRQATANAEGRFTFQSVPAGDYSLSTRASTAPRTTGQAVLDLWAQADVVVSGHDVENVSLGLEPASSITGQLTFDGTAVKPPEDFSSIRLEFVATEALAAMMSGAGSLSVIHNAVVNRDGTFKVDGLPPDRYTAAASWPGMRTGDGTSGWWLSSMRVEGRDLADAPIDVRPNAIVREVALIFRDRIGTIEGALTDAAGRPAPEYFVMAFPVERTSWTTTSRRVSPPTRPGTDGRYRVTGLLAGEYYLAVVTSVSQDDATDAAFLDSIIPTALRVRVGDGEVKRQDLQIK